MELNGEDVEELNGNETKVGVLSKRESLHSSGRRASSKVGRSGTLKLVIDKDAKFHLDPDDDIVLVWHWYENSAMDGMLQRLMGAVK